jgi:hypothetical protein
LPAPGEPTTRRIDASLCANRSTTSRVRRPPVRSPRPGRGVQLALRFWKFPSSPSSQAHLTTSAPFRVRAMPVSGQLCGTTGGGASHRVPVSCCLSAAGIRFLVILCPLGDWASLTVGLPARSCTSRTPTGLSRFARMRSGRGGCPLYPRDCGTHTAGTMSPTAARRLPTAGPYRPSTATHHQGMD